MLQTLNAQVVSAIATARDKYAVAIALESNGSILNSERNIWAIAAIATSISICSACSMRGRDWG